MLKFGTDGVRGVANLDLTPELVLALGRAAAARPRRDRASSSGATPGGRGRCSRRRSSPGSRAEGVDVATLGVVPTPAVAWLAAADGVAGAVISASHNPFDDNGVKLFAAGGRKLTDDVEDARSRPSCTRCSAATEPASARTGDAVGTVVDGSGRASSGGPTRWSRRIEGRGLDGLRVVVDCANGAASRGRARGAAGARRRGARCSTTSRTAPTSTPAAGRPTPRTCRRAVVDARRRRRARLRRRRRPGARRRRRRPARSTATRSSRICAIDRHARGAPGQGHGRRHRDDQPRASGSGWRSTASRWSRCPSATATCSRRSPTRARRSAASRAAT